MKHEKFDKVIRVKRLKELLSTIDENLFVCANKVYNLTILNDCDEYRGFIDIKFEKVDTLQKENTNE